MSNVIPFPTPIAAETLKVAKLARRRIVYHDCAVMRATVSALEGNRCRGCGEILTFNKDGEQPDGAA